MANEAPLNPTWVAAIHATVEDYAPLGPQWSSTSGAC